MANDGEHKVTRLLDEIRAGRKEALDELFRAVYSDLHAVAVRRMRNAPEGSLLQPTALVNETYLRLFGEHPAQVNDRKHFFSLAATAMARILVDLSHSERAAKRGGRPQRVTIQSFMQVAPASADELVKINDAIAELANIDERAAEVVRMTYFAGRDTEDIAEFFGVSPRTVQRDLTVARAFLQRHVRADETVS
jgi:RNA polymerase sigma factor (TIGR02999 family)